VIGWSLTSKGKGFMKLRTARLLMVTSFIACAESLFAQVYQNPLEWMATAEGNDAINKEISSQIKGQTETAVLQNTIAAEFKKIHEWERKYSDYTKTVSGYASSLKAASGIYDDALRIFITLGNLKKACEDNPQGIVATLSMNTLYLESATELVSAFTLIRNAVANGGTTNMLTGAERSEVLWAIDDKLSEFNKKIRRLYLSIHYYTLLDVWYNMSAGVIDRNPGDIARQAHERWKRMARAIAY
jgi:hypothetical protein